MNIIIGMDISKTNLDIFDSLSKKYQRFPNTSQEIAEIIECYDAFPLKKIIMESTGEV